jgi:uncharacterized protein (TIGR03089 family)
VLLDEAKMREQFDLLRRDVAPDTPEAAEAEPAASRSSSRRRASASRSQRRRRRRARRRAYDDLAAVGFQIVGARTTAGRTRTTTSSTARTRPTRPARWPLRCPGSRTELDPSLTRTLEVVVGADYTGARPVKVTGSRAGPEAACRVRAPGQDRRPGPVRGLTAWTAGLAGERDPAQPLLTLQRPRARVEVSGATTANWVAKSANLLVDGLGAPGRVGLLLPPALADRALLLAGVASGATVVVAADTDGLAGCDAAFVLAAHAGAALDAGVDEVLALSGHPLGARAAGLPALVADYAREVPSYADHWGGPAPAAPTVEVAGAPLPPAARPRSRTGGPRPRLRRPSRPATARRAAGRPARRSGSRARALARPAGPAAGRGAGGGDGRSRRHRRGHAGPAGG